MTVLFRCDNEGCGSIHSLSSAKIEVKMWDCIWQFCSGTCLSEWVGQMGGRGVEGVRETETSRGEGGDKLTFDDFAADAEK